MAYEWLTYTAATTYLLLGLSMLYRVVTRLKGQSYSEMTVQTRFGIIVFVVLLIYCLTRVIFLYCQAAGAFSGSALNVTTNFLAAVPATLFLILQATLLYKWNLHVSDVTEVLHQDRFRVGGTLMASSIGLSISCTAIAIAGACDLRAQRWFNPTEWNILLSLFYGVAYIFNGASFLGLGIYLRWLWTPITVKAKRASYRILGIAVVFGLCCTIRGCVIVYYIRPRIESNGGKVPMSDTEKTASEYAQTIIYILECVCLAFSLVFLTSTDGQPQQSKNGNVSSSNNNNNHGVSHRSGTGINDDGDNDSEYSRGGAGRSLRQPLYRPTLNPDGTDEYCCVDVNETTGSVRDANVPAKLLAAALEPRAATSGLAGKSGGSALAAAYGGGTNSSAAVGTAYAGAPSHTPAASARMSKAHSSGLDFNPTANNPRQNDNRTINNTSLAQSIGTRESMGTINGGDHNNNSSVNTYTTTAMGISGSSYRNSARSDIVVEPSISSSVGVGLTMNNNSSDTNNSVFSAANSQISRPQLPPVGAGAHNGNPNHNRYDAIRQSYQSNKAAAKQGQGGRKKIARHITVINNSSSNNNNNNCSSPQSPNTTPSLNDGNEDMQR